MTPRQRQLRRRYTHIERLVLRLHTAEAAAGSPGALLWWSDSPAVGAALRAVLRAGEKIAKREAKS